MIDLKNNPFDDKVLSQKEKNSVRRWLSVALICFALLALVIAIDKVYGLPEPTGIINYSDSILLAWNQGRIENETYFNKTSGLVQHANYLNRINDIRYVFGGGVKTGSSITVLLFDEIPGNVTYSSDSLTYWKATSYMNKSIGGDWYYVSKDNNQLLNDDYVNMEFSISTNNAGGKVFYIITGIKQMDIGRDGIYEKISLVNETDVIEWDNRSGSRTWYNISRITIDGDIYSFDIYFEKPLEVRYNKSTKQTNGDWLFFDEMGVINNYVEYSSTYDWIDATCVITCSGACTLDINSNSTDNSHQQLRKFANVGCRTQNGVACGITSCSHSTSCVLEWVHDYPELDESSWHSITRNNNETPLECGTTWCNKTNPTRGTWYYSDLNTSRSSFPSGEYTHFTCGMLQSSGTWKTSYDFLGFTTLYNSTPIEINITLGNPQNPWLLNNTINWAVFLINQSRANVTKYDNISLIFNASINYTSAPNLTRNVTFTSNGIWNWTGLACFRYNCQYAWNGNKSISQQSIPIIVTLRTIKFWSFLIDRSWI